jgi:DUF1680 family protein
MEANQQFFGGPAATAESCGVGDMTFIACRLTEAGIGDYWEDIDRYVRNHMVEVQLLRRDLMEECVAAAPKFEPDPLVDDCRQVIDRTMGLFLTCSDPTLAQPWWTKCCQGNIPVGLYQAWESIVRYNQGLAQVNLLLNRASRWVDVDSYLPYEGKVVLKNKTAEKLSVRIPLWADKRAVRCQVNGANLPVTWLGNYVLVDRVSPGDKVTITFPMVETTEYYTDRSYGTRYTCRFKGNTLIDISPRAEKFNWTKITSDDGTSSETGKGYPMYQRDFYKRDKAPMKKVTRYVHPYV